MNGKSGLFPSNFVEELETTGEEPEPKNTSANVTGNSTVTNPDRDGLGVSTTASSGLGGWDFRKQCTRLGGQDGTPSLDNGRRNTDLILNYTKLKYY